MGQKFRESLCPKIYVRMTRIKGFGNYKDVEIMAIILKLCEKWKPQSISNRRKLLLKLAFPFVATLLLDHWLVLLDRITVRCEYSSPFGARGRCPTRRST